MPISAKVQPLHSFLHISIPNTNFGMHKFIFPFFFYARCAMHSADDLELLAKAILLCDEIA